MEIRNSYAVPHSESGGQARAPAAPGRPPFAPQRTPRPEAASPKTSALASRPHARAAQVALDIEYHRNMLDLHQRVSPKDVLVGWYSTGGGGITDTDALIHVRRRMRRAARTAYAWRTRALAQRPPPAPR